MITRLPQHPFNGWTDVMENPKPVGNSLKAMDLFQKDQPVAVKEPSRLLEDDLFLIDSTFLLKASEAAFLGAPLLVDPEGRDHTHVFGVLRDILKLRKRVGIRQAAIIVGQESVAATSEPLLADLLSFLAELRVTVVRDDRAPVVDISGRYAELYGSIEAALADASSAPSVDWKRKVAPRKDALLQRMAETEVRRGTPGVQAQNLSGAFIDDSKRRKSMATIPNSSRSIFVVLHMRRRALPRTVTG